MDLVPASRFSTEQLTELYNQTRVDYLVPMPMNPRRLQEYIDVYDIDLDASVVAVDGDDRLGVCMLGIREGRCWITRLGVLPPGRRRGTGQAMMEYCIQQAADRQIPIIYLEVIVGNTPACTLFAKLGFSDVRKLLILRRPPGLPRAIHEPPPANMSWLGINETLAHAHTCPWRPAWVNQTESLVNAGNVKGIHLTEHVSGRSGWVSYQRTALQIRRVVVAPDEGVIYAPAYNLLFRLHTEFATLDTVAENVPANAPHLDAFYAHGYVDSFARIEMKLVLSAIEQPDESRVEPPDYSSSSSHAGPASGSAT